MKKGFSIIELLVVMSLMAMIFALSIAGILSANNTNIIEKASQDLLTGIREAQNRSISVTFDQGGTKLPIAWAIHVNSGSKLAELVDLTPQSPGTGLDWNVTTLTDFGSVKALDSVNISVNGTNPSDAYLFFSTPLGRFYSSDQSCVPANGTCAFQNDATTRPADYSLKYISPAVNPWLNQTIDIDLSFRGQTRRIEIKPNGDAYVK